MRSAVIIAAAMAVALAGYFLFFKTPDYTNYPPRPGPILAFGDSLVAGAGADEGRDFVSLVGQAIGEPVENFGVSGDTTKEALARVDAAVARHPRIVLVLLGGNDYLQRIPKEETFRNLSTIIDRFQQDGAVVMLLGVRGGLLSDNFAGDFKTLARDKGALHVPDVLDNLLGDKRYMSDAIHPNNAGYAVIAERVAQALQPVLK